MIHFLLRLYYTLKDLRLIQIIYQLINKFHLRNFLSSDYHKQLQYSFYKLKLDSNLYICESQNVSVGYSFEFLNKKIIFQDQIDWNYNLNGKLWNYNLQYLDFILYDNLNLEYRKELIKNISRSILDRHLMLEPYPVSLRINNLLLFDGIYGIDDKEVYEAMSIQINYLSKNLEFHLLGNHLLENYITLLISSYSLRDSILFAKFSKLLKAEINEQILNDGGHFERSPMYHSIILQRLLMCIDIMNRNDIFSDHDLKNFLIFKAGLMLGWLNEMSFSDGKWPCINDSSIDISLTKQQLEKNAKKLAINWPKIKLSSSGFRKIKSKLFELIINTGEITPKYQPGHAHSDILSFYLSDGFRHLIVDTGVSTYDSGRTRNRERSTISHNTLIINKSNQSDTWGEFRVGKKAKVKILVDEINKLKSKVYNLGFFTKASYTREFTLTDNDLIVTDIINSKNENLENCIHFNHDLKPLQKGDILYFDNYKLEYQQGLIEMRLVSYEQATGFNSINFAYKMISRIEKQSKFIITKVK